MRALIRRFTSRKFLLSVAGLVTLALNGQWNEFTFVLLGYVGAEGGADLVERLKTGVSTLNTYVNSESHNDVDIEEVDTTRIITGKATPMFDEEPIEE